MKKPRQCYKIKHICYKLSHLSHSNALSLIPGQSHPCLDFGSKGQRFKSGRPDQQKKNGQSSLREINSCWP